jgi:hypothetical protein
MRGPTLKLPLPPQLDVAMESLAFSSTELPELTHLPDVTTCVTDGFLVIYLNKPSTPGDVAFDILMKAFTNIRSDILSIFFTILIRMSCFFLVAFSFHFIYLNHCRKMWPLVTSVSRANLIQNATVARVTLFTIELTMTDSTNQLPRRFLISSNGTDLSIHTFGHGDALSSWCWKRELNVASSFDQAFWNRCVPYLPQ